MEQLLDGIDLGKLPALVDLIRIAEVWNCPTLMLDQPYRQDAEWQREATLLPPRIIDRSFSFILIVTVVRLSRPGGVAAELKMESSEDNLTERLHSTSTLRDVLTFWEQSDGKRKRSRNSWLSYNMIWREIL